MRLWREYFWPHSRAALRQIGLTEKHTKARRVLCWIRTNRKAEVISAGRPGARPGAQLQFAQACCASSRPITLSDIGVRRRA